MCLLLLVASEAPVSRPTPLYGQPLWWGEDDAEHSEGQRPAEDPAGLEQTLLYYYSINEFVDQDM